MSVVMERTFGKERRLQRRFDVLQAARLKTAAGGQFECEIHNFCLGGLFLKLDARQTGLPPLGDGEAVEVSFNPPPSLGGHSIALKARLVRQNADGLGVAFVGTPIEATRMLNKIATSMRTQRLAGKRYQGMDGKQLQETCRSLLAPTLQDAFSEFYGLVQERLSAAASQLTNFAERNEMVAAYDAIRMGESTSREAAQQGMQAAFEQFLKRKRTQEKPQGKGSLSLVQTEEFEDWLNLTTDQGAELLPPVHVKDRMTRTDHGA